MVGHCHLTYTGEDGQGHLSCTGEGRLGYSYPGEGGQGLTSAVQVRVGIICFHAGGGQGQLGYSRQS